MLSPHHLIYSLLSRVAMMLTLVLCVGCEDNSHANGVAWHAPANEGTMPPGFDGFTERWNKQVSRRLAKDEADLTKKIESLNRLLATADNEKQRAALQGSLQNAQRELAVIKHRQAEGDYIKFKTPADIPADLTWEDGLDNPDIGDPRAKKGGVIRQWMAGSFPATFRPIGPGANNGFRGCLYDELEIGLVGIHPVTGKIIPGLAHKWAVADDKRTVYFQLDPDAAYNDGVKVKTVDFLVNMFIRTSEYSKNILYNTVFYNNASNITIYDDRHLSVTLSAPKPLLPFYCTDFKPAPPHFYCEFGPDYVERYQWRVPPTTGAYRLKPDGVTLGRTVTLERAPDWWAKDKKFTRYAFNVDRIVYTFIGDPSKAIELFRIGELDVLPLGKPDWWHKRMEIPEVHNGYIHRATFYTIYPRPTRGIFLNTSKPPFNDLHVRLGFHHAMNIQGLIDQDFRGDYQRLHSFSSGFGRFTNPHLRARAYSPEQARQYFAKAGYNIPCADGILRKEDGTRLTASLTFSNVDPTMIAIMNKLKEDARKCGLELIPDPLDSTVSYRKIIEKRAQAAFSAWSIAPPHPKNIQGFHSGFAYDEKGQLITYTTNITACATPEMDALLDAEANATTEEEMQQATWKVQQAIHDRALWVPAWTSEFARLGYWRWVKWPDSDTTRFCHPAVFTPLESYLFWIDNDVKKETLKARREGRVFEEVDAIYDQYRSTPATTTISATLSSPQ